MEDGEVPGATACSQPGRRLLDSEMLGDHSPELCLPVHTAQTASRIRDPVATSASRDAAWGPRGRKAAPEPMTSCCWATKQFLHSQNQTSSGGSGDGHGTAAEVCEDPRHKPSPRSQGPLRLTHSKAPRACHHPSVNAPQDGG